MRVPVPNADSIVRIVAEATRLPGTAAATARALPSLAKGAVDDTRRLGVRGTAVAVTGAAFSSAASIATSLLARRHPLDASTADPDTHAPNDESGDEGAPLDELDRFATADDWEAEVGATATDDEASADPGAATEETPATGPRDDAPAATADDRATAPFEAAASLADEVAEDHAEAVESGEHLAGRELPLPDFDGMTIGSLRGHLRSLGVDDLVTLRAYEQAHANRVQVLTMLENRIAKLAQDES